MSDWHNVFGEPLQVCCTSPMTGFYRNGYCETDEQDRGSHVVCAQVTQEFLRFSKQHGNDLVTPALEYGFPGLKPGDRWCLCAVRWRQALEVGVAPRVILSATHEAVLKYVSLDDLKRHALDLS